MGQYRVNRGVQADSQKRQNFVRSQVEFLTKESESKGQETNERRGRSLANSQTNTGGAPSLSKKNKSIRERTESGGLETETVQKLKTTRGIPHFLLSIGTPEKEKKKKTRPGLTGPRAIGRPPIGPNWSATSSGGKERFRHTPPQQGLEQNL